MVFLDTLKKSLTSIIIRSTSLYFSIKLARQLVLLYKNISSSKSFTKTTGNSKSAYDAYDDFEQIKYKNESRISLYKGKLYRMPFKESREFYLNYLYTQIDETLSRKEHIKVLEVGAGNCINLSLLKQRYGNKVELTGIDISQKRLDISSTYFGEKLKNVNLFDFSITNKIEKWSDNEFDVVFSMHCLEQIAYRTEDAVKEMYRLSKESVVMIEPVFELGNRTQRLYLINSDHNRILLKTINELGLPIEKLETLDIQSNPINQSSIIVIKKK